jgi:hypothetical protein
LNDACTQTEEAPESEASSAIVGEVATASKFAAAAIGTTRGVTNAVAAELDLGETAFEGGSGFGFVTSQGKLEEDAVQRMIRADEGLREAPLLSDEAVVALKDRVVAGLWALKQRAPSDTRWKWKQIIEIFSKAVNAPQALRIAAVEAYSHKSPDEVSFRAALDASLRGDCRVSGLDIDAVRQALSAAKDLGP